MVISTRSDTNQAELMQKIAKGLNFQCRRLRHSIITTQLILSFVFFFCIMNQTREGPNHTVQPEDSCGFEIKDLESSGLYTKTDQL